MRNSLVASKLSHLRSHSDGQLSPRCFRTRVIEIGMGDCLPYLDSKHLDTYTNFAYGCSANPATATMELVEEKLLTPTATVAGSYKD